jgi:hypothetical protein
MHEEMAAHWRNARVTAVEEFEGRAITVYRILPQAERSRLGFCLCNIAEGKRPAGQFTLYRDGRVTQRDGFLSRDLDHAYHFERSTVPEQTDWPELLAFAKEALHANYNFPDDWSVRSETYDLRSKIELLKRNFPSR